MLLLNQGLFVSLFVGFHFIDFCLYLFSIHLFSFFVFYLILVCPFWVVVIFAVLVGFDPGSRSCLGRLLCFHFEVVVRYFANVLFLFSSTVRSCLGFTLGCRLQSLQVSLGFRFFEFHAYLLLADEAYSGGVQGGRSWFWHLLGLNGTHSSFVEQISV